MTEQSVMMNSWWTARWFSIFSTTQNKITFFTLSIPSMENHDHDLPQYSKLIIIKKLETDIPDIIYIIIHKFMYVLYMNKVISSCVCQYLSTSSIKQCTLYICEPRTHAHCMEHVCNVQHVSKCHMCLQQKCSSTWGSVCLSTQLSANEEVRPRKLLHSEYK